MPIWNQKLKELRERNGWSQKELAKKLDVKQSTIAAYEAGRNEPKIDTLLRITDLFHVSLDYLFGRQDASGDNATLYEAICSLSERDRNILKKTVKAFSDTADEDIPG